MPRNARTEWYIQLINGRTGRPIDDDAGVVNVLENGDPSEVTIYATEDETTALANPTTFGDGALRFFTANTVTAVDLAIQTNDGYYFFLEGLTPSQHRYILWPEQEGNKIAIPFQVVGASSTIVDTGFNIHNRVLVRDVYLHVTTAAGAAQDIDVGTSTDPNGFIDGATVAATGPQAGSVLGETLTAASATAGGIGNLLTHLTTNTYLRKLHQRANATSGRNIVYTNVTDSGTAGEGYIYMIFERHQTPVA